VARLRRANASLAEDLQRAHRRADRLARRAAAGACTYAAGTLPWRSEGRRQAGCVQACSSLEVLVLGSGMACCSS
jgi:hypothetical protein